MKIKCSPAEAQMVREVCIRLAMHIQVVERESQKGFVLIDLPGDHVDALRDGCAEMLQEVGFDTNYNPTECGRTLEGLIDKLFL